MKFTCDWCGRDTYDDNEYLGYTLHGPGDAPYEPIELCRNCFISAVQALQFGKEVMQDCQINGNGRRIYVAVEATSGGENELVNALVWPNTPLSENVRSAVKNSVSYRLSQDSLESPVR